MQPFLQEIRWEKIAEAGWFAFPKPLQYGIDFVWGAVILMLFMSIVTTIETIGDISATTMGGANREATDTRIVRRYNGRWSWNSFCINF